MIDGQQLTAISAGAPELILEILADFHAEAKTKLSELSQSLTQKDLKNAAQLLHQLSGSSGTLGLSDFHQSTKESESQCLSDQHPGEISDSLSLLLESSVSKAQEFLRSNSTSS